MIGAALRRRAGTSSPRSCSRRPSPSARRSSPRPTPPAPRSSSTCRGCTTASRSRSTSCSPPAPLGTLTYGRVRLSHDGAVARLAAGALLRPRGRDRRRPDRPRLPPGLPDPALARRAPRDGRRDATARSPAARSRTTPSSPPGTPSGRIGVIETGFVSAEPVRDRAARDRRRPVLRRAAGRPADLRRRGLEHTARAGRRRRRVRALGRPHPRRDPRGRQPRAGGRADAPRSWRPTRRRRAGRAGRAADPRRPARRRRDRGRAPARLRARTPPGSASPRWPTPATGERRAQQLGATAYDDFRTLIAEADVDAVDICLPHHLHRDAVVAAAASRAARPVREAALPDRGRGGRGARRPSPRRGSRSCAPTTSSSCPPSPRRRRCSRPARSAASTRSARPTASSTASTPRTWAGARARRRAAGAS